VGSAAIALLIALIPSCLRMIFPEQKIKRQRLTCSVSSYGGGVQEDDIYLKLFGIMSVAVVIFSQ
jgi:hypothetical protein